MLIKHINKNTFDIFYNVGWDYPARFEITQDNNKRTIEQKKGEKVPAPIFHYLNKKYGISK